MRRDRTVCPAEPGPVSAAAARSADLNAVVAFRKHSTDVCVGNIAASKVAPSLHVSAYFCPEVWRR